MSNNKIDKERQNVFIAVDYTFDHNLNAAKFAALKVSGENFPGNLSFDNPFKPDTKGTVYRVYNENDINNFYSGAKNFVVIGKINKANWKKLENKALRKGTYSDAALNKLLNKLIATCNDKKINSAGFSVEIKGDNVMLIARKPATIKEGGKMTKKNDLVKQKEEIALVEQEYMERDRLRKVREMREIEEIQESIDARESTRQEALKKKKSFAEFSMGIKDSLLAESMISIYEASLPNDLKLNPANKNIGIGMINTFIKENGTNNILTNVKYNSLFLSELGRMVNTYHKAIIEKVDTEDPDFKLDSYYKDDFFDNLKGEDFDELTDTIRMRVSDAIEEFIQSNINNKIDIDEVITHTKDKIDNAGYGTSEEVKQEYANIGKRRIEKIKNRKYGILESIVQKISKSAITNKTIAESYTEDGKLNMDKIVESATAIYTFLEMLNTAKFVNIDESYVKNFLDNLD